MSLLILSLRVRSTISSLVLLLVSMTPDSIASKESTVKLGLVLDDNDGEEDEDAAAAPVEKDRRLRSWMEISSLSLPGIALSDAMMAW